MSTEQNESKAGTPLGERLGSAEVEPRDYTGCVYSRNCRDCTGHGCDCEQRVAPHKYTRGPANNLYVYG